LMCQALGTTRDRLLRRGSGFEVAPLITGDGSRQDRKGPKPQFAVAPGSVHSGVSFASGKEGEQGR
jgi:hypothetical protein